jgi:hypothetical protein
VASGWAVSRVNSGFQSPISENIVIVLWSISHLLSEYKPIHIHWREQRMDQSNQQFIESKFPPRLSAFRWAGLHKGSVDSVLPDASPFVLSPTSWNDPI